MPTNVIMPALGVAQQTGTLLKWLKTEGQSVTKGEPLMEIETDKATVEIEAPTSGMLTQVIAQAGDEVPVGQRIAMILEPGESLPAATKSATPKRVASPAAKRIAREHEIEIAALSGSGPDGSILAEDVLRAASGKVPQPTAATAGQKTVPLTPMRRIVG